MISPADLVIAVSRRFHRPETDELYAGTIEPVLMRYGTVLRCDFASDAVGDVNFWMNRMNIILDIADVHVFVDFDRSANTFYELYSSNMSCLYGPGVAMLWNFGVSPPVRETPNQIIVYRSGDGIARVSLTAGLAQKRPLHAKTGLPVEEGLPQALETMATALREFRAGFSDDAWSSEAGIGLRPQAATRFCVFANEGEPT